MRFLCYFVTFITLCGSATANEFEALRFRDQSGAIHSLKEWEGKVVLLNIWASWCKPCVLELPALDRLHGALKNEKVEVLTINVDGSDLTMAESFFRVQKIEHLTLYSDPESRILSQLKIRALPTSFLFNAKGELVKTFLGPREWDKEEMQEYLKSVE